jgi:hypothetical protein
VPILDKRLRDIADELYALAPGDFVAARDERAAAARKAGDRDLARLVKGLRRPSAAAWAVNALVRQRPQEIDRLLELGGSFRVAQAELARDDLRELNRRRQEVLAELSRWAGALAEAAGHPLGEPTRRQVQATLAAAMADPVAGAAVRSGLLTGELESTGFAPVEVEGAVALPPDPAVIDAIEQAARVPAEPRERTSVAERSARTRPTAAEAAAAATSAEPAESARSAESAHSAEPAQSAAARRREEAERAVTRADEALTHAARVRDEARDAVQRLAVRRDELRARIADLDRRVREARSEDEGVAREERRARRELDAATRAARAAESQAADARRRLNGVP